MAKKTSSRKLIIIIIPVVVAVVAIGFVLAFSTIGVTSTGNNNGGDDNPNGNSNGGTNGGGSTIDHGGGPGAIILPTVDSTAANNLGFPIDVGENVGMVSTLLENSEDRISFRFTTKYSGTIETLVVNLLTGGNYSTNISAGLQEDSRGYPSGVWLGEPGVGSGQADQNGFTEIKLQSPAQVTKGKVYHLVIRATTPENTDGVRVRMYHLNSFVQPLNDENLDKPWQDPAMSSLQYDAKLDRWMAQETWPMFIVKYADGKSEGQPYSLSAPWIIYGKRYVGQEFVPSSDYVVNGFGFAVSYGGSPADKLYYEVRDSANKVLTKGLFTEASKIERPRSFMEVKLNQPLTLEKGEHYRFILLSPASTAKEPYHLYGHEFTYDKSIGFGGTQQLLTISYDAGSTWTRWEDADSIFDITKT